MLPVFLSLLTVLLLTALFLRGGFALTLIYLVIGALLAGTWWSRRALRQVTGQRSFTTHAFLGEKIRIRLEIKNKGWLPVPWLELREAVPVELVGPNNFQAAIQLGPRAQAEMEYFVVASKRGYYPIGPLLVATGDIFGFGESRTMQAKPEALIVYPKIIRPISPGIPSRSPQGTLQHWQPVFEDPTRLFGKRGYTSGDSLRRIDWKASASSGRLQVKLFEPSIALETCIILNLNAQDYFYRSRIDSTELAIVIAASLSDWLVSKKQMVGLLVNGSDPMADGHQPKFIPAHKGKPHLMHLLETLARVQVVEQASLGPLLQMQRYKLAWGTTLILITGGINEVVLDELYQARRAGKDALLILAGKDAGEEGARRRAAAFDIPVISIPTERELEAWAKEAMTL